MGFDAKGSYIKPQLPWEFFACQVIAHCTAPISLTRDRESASLDMQRRVCRGVVPRPSGMQVDWGFEGVSSTSYTPATQLACRFGTEVFFWAFSELEPFQKRGNVFARFRTTAEGGRACCIQVVCRPLEAARPRENMVATTEEMFSVGCVVEIPLTYNRSSSSCCLWRERNYLSPRTTSSLWVRRPDSFSVEG